MTGKTQKLECSDCNNSETIHRIIHEFSQTDHDEHHSWGGYFQTCQCLGCNTVRFVASYWHDANYDHHHNTGEPILNYLTYIYPDRAQPTLDSKLFIALPSRLAELYQETAKAIFHDLNSLAGAGIRAMVENMCIDKGISTGDLEKKIEKLKDVDYITRAQVDVLDTIRIIGNVSIHQTKISMEDIRTGFNVVEKILYNIYVTHNVGTQLVLKKEEFRKKK